MLYRYCCHPKNCSALYIVLFGNQVFFFFFFNFSTSAPLYPSKYDVCHVLQKLGHINPKGFSPPCGTDAFFFFNPRLLYQKMNHDGNDIIIFMLHCFAIELCYVCACIAFVNVLILYCNKVFEISNLKYNCAIPRIAPLWDQHMDISVQRRCIVGFRTSELLIL